MIELLLPEQPYGASLGLEDRDGVVDLWQTKLDDKRLWVRVLCAAETVEPTLDRLKSRFGHLEGFRLVLQSVDATVPPLDTSLEAAKPKTSRVSRHELLTSIGAATRLGPRYLLMVVLSAIVAAVGLLTNNVAVIIAAMVIAPLLGPNMALALATVTGDQVLGSRALRMDLYGIGVALAMAIAIGLLLDPQIFSDPSHPLQEIMARTQVGLPDLLLALAAGTAGALTFTTGGSGTLIGVMVAVALMPPLIVLGLMIGQGMWEEAARAALLFVLNILSIILSGVATFWLDGIRAAKWWEIERTNRATRRAATYALILLTIAALAATYYGYDIQR